MRAPSLQEGNGIATKVTETLIESPRIRLTRSLMLPLALVSTNPPQSQIYMIDLR
jgi:hypothetical protein